MPEPLVDATDIEAVHLAAFLVRARRMSLERLAVQSHTAGGTPVTEQCPVACLGLSRHAYYPLVRAHGGPETVGDVLNLLLRDELGDIRGLGRRRIGEIRTSLIHAGFTLDHGHGRTPRNDHDHIP